ncbi:MAG TPA: GntR family transcriptional regulator [Actinomycetota bacterium]|nr:GntR family transcriptional regulator [Actinomycetota bacterium]
MSEGATRHAGPPASGEITPPPVRRVRRDIPIPYYAQLSQILADEIGSGVWQPGDTLPSEADLCAAHGVSRTAVRQALGELAARGLVRKQRGRRTSVAGATSLVVQEVRGLYDELSALGGSVRTQVLHLGVTRASPRVAHDLQLPPANDVVMLSRLRFVDEAVIVRVDTYLPIPRFIGLLDEDLTDRSLYGLLGTSFGVRPSSGRRFIEAVAVDDDTATQLGVAKNSPALKLTAVNFDQDGAPFETFRAWYRGDTTRFEVVVDS